MIDNFDVIKIAIAIVWILCISITYQLDIIRKQLNVIRADLWEDERFVE